MRLHFIFETTKEPNARFAESLIDKLGQFPRADADVLVVIGGDGLLLDTLRNANGKPVYGLTVPGSNSCGFWLEHDIHTAEELVKHIETARTLPLRPLEAEITFANKNKTIRRSFNSLAIERAAGQAVLMNLTATFNGVATDPVRIMGDGFVFSTAMGSTGLNRSYGGPAVDAGSDVIIMTGKGIFDPRGINPVVVSDLTAEFHVDFCSSSGKRPMRIDYDGQSVSADADGSAIESVIVRRAGGEPAKLLVNTPPQLKAFSVLKS